VRGLVYQILLVAVVAFLLYEASTNAYDNLRRVGIVSGFGFLDNTAGFDISQAFIPYSARRLHLRRGVRRRSSQHADRRRDRDRPRDVPRLRGRGSAALDQLDHQQARHDLRRGDPQRPAAPAAPVLVQRGPGLPAGAARLNQRRNELLPQQPRPDHAEAGGSTSGPGSCRTFLAIGIVAAIAFRVFARREQEATGRQYPVGLVALGLILGLPALAWIFLALTGGNPITFDLPQRSRFNLTGGTTILPEFVALLVGLVTYTAGFIAEVVRAGILAVSRGQTEAANALGLRPGPTLRLGGDPAGHARDHPAADEPVPQPDQELVAGGGDRLPRPRPGLHGHGA
jgi:general L-amino acid transport system permease protein